MSKKSLLLRMVLLLSLLLLAGCAEREAEWTPLFDGETLDGWQAGENPGSVSVVDGQIVCNGPRAHLFYMGDSAAFKNFELKADVRARHGANSGLYFHTAYQDEGWPGQGYEVQINNTATGEGGYVERKKTGSLYGIRNIYRQLVPDDEWFTLHVKAEGRHITTKVNDTVVTDYVLPEGPLAGGTFALQCHDPGSTVYFKNIMVRRLPADAPTPAIEPPVTDSLYTKILRLNRSNYPLIDWHVHLKEGLTLEAALAKSRRDGIQYGIAVNGGLGFPITDDAGIYAFLDSVRGAPVFVGLQGEGREWVDLFSDEALEAFDYVFTDAMTFTDDQGRRTRLWIDDEVYIDDAQQFMDTYVDRILGVINDEPIDLYVNPTFLPEALRDQYDALWTDARMQQVIDAAVANDVAIEINARYRIPSERFIRMAKDAGATFACGTNNTGPADLGRLAYCVEMIDKVGLESGDLFLPERAATPLLAAGRTAP